VAVAPDREQSWMGKSISGHHDLHFTPVAYHEFEGWHVNGTPADCTQLGLYETGGLPDFVLSGLNHGSNIGHAYTISSGTVGAAFEAAFQGVPAFAASVWEVKEHNHGIDFDARESVEVFRTAAAVTRKIVDKVLEAGFPSSVQIVSINVPHDVRPDTKWVITSPHSLRYGRIFVSEDGVYRNRVYDEQSGRDAPFSDLAALEQGYVSIVPITLQLTSDAGRKELARALDVPLFE